MRAIADRSFKEFFKKLILGNYCYSFILELHSNNIFKCKKVNSYYTNYFLVIKVLPLTYPGSIDELLLSLRLLCRWCIVPMSMFFWPYFALWHWSWMLGWFYLCRCSGSRWCWRCIMPMTVFLWPYLTQGGSSFYFHFFCFCLRICLWNVFTGYWKWFLLEDTKTWSCYCFIWFAQLCYGTEGKLKMIFKKTIYSMLIF